MGRTAPTVAKRTATPKGRESKPPTSLLLAHCAIDARRTVLATLCEATECPVPELADRVVAAREDVDPGAVPEGARRDAVVSLYHNHLQKLEAAFVVDLDESGSDVTASLAPAVDHERLRSLIDAGDGHWDTLGVILGDPRRERIVSLLVSADDQSLSLEALARAIAALERGAGGSPPESAIESTRVSLHHVHLPKLQDAGLVEYDESRSVTLETVPEAYEVVVDAATGEVTA